MTADAFYAMDWLAAGKVAHICVDNQAYYASSIFHRDGMIHTNQVGFSHYLAHVTHSYRHILTTVHVQAPLWPLTVNKLIDEGFTVRYGIYDDAAKKVYDETGKGCEEWIDLVNPFYAKDFVHMKHSQDMWEGTRGDTLDAKLRAMGCDKLLITGAFGEACVKEAVFGAQKRGYEAMVDPALIFSYYADQTMDVTRARELYQDKAIVTAPEATLNALASL